VAGSCKHGNKPSGAIMWDGEGDVGGGGVSSLAEWLLDF
jgi:hypothetical protein